MRSNKCKDLRPRSISFRLYQRIYLARYVYVRVTSIIGNNGKQRRASYPTLLSKTLIRGKNHLLNGGHLLREPWRPSSGTIEANFSRPRSILSFDLIAAFRISNLSHPCSRGRNNFFLKRHRSPSTHTRSERVQLQPPPLVDVVSRGHLRCVAFPSFRFTSSPREAFLLRLDHSCDSVSRAKLIIHKETLMRSSSV